MYNTKNITFRTYEIDLKTIADAAKKAGKNVSDYVRDTVIPVAYADTGRRREDLPKLERGRYGGVVAQAARLAGMTPEELRKQASENLAHAILNAKAKEAGGGGRAPKGESSRSGVRESEGKIAVRDSSKKAR